MLPRFSCNLHPWKWFTTYVENHPPNSYKILHFPALPLHDSSHVQPRTNPTADSPTPSLTAQPTPTSRYHYNTLPSQTLRTWPDPPSQPPTPASIVSPAAVPTAVRSTGVYLHNVISRCLCHSRLTEAKNVEVTTKGGPLKEGTYRSDRSPPRYRQLDDSFLGPVEGAANRACVLNICISTHTIPLPPQHQFPSLIPPFPSRTIEKSQQQKVYHRPLPRLFPGENLQIDQCRIRGPTDPKPRHHTLQQPRRRIQRGIDRPIGILNQIVNSG